MNSMMQACVAIVLLMGSFNLSADSHSGKHPQTENAAMEAMVAELGLYESEIPSRDFPGWAAPEKVVAWVDSPERLAGFQAVAPGVEFVAWKRLWLKRPTPRS